MGWGVSRKKMLIGSEVVWGSDIEEGKKVFSGRRNI